MCTAVLFHTNDHYFGRTLDVECSYGEELAVLPRRMPLAFRGGRRLETHFAILGMAMVVEGQPLFFDGVNEAGVAMAGLNFAGNACYFPRKEERENVPPFELIPWVLSQCGSVQEAKKRLQEINLWDLPFSDALPLSPLHWMIADKHASIVVESLKAGLKIYDNPLGVMTNNPPFDYHLTHLADFMQLSHLPSENRLGAEGVKAYSRGMGAMGLPGDWSSASRFVRAAFVKGKAACEKGEAERVRQFFHIMGTVEQVKGCVQLEDGRNELTDYSACMNLEKGIYYYTTYENGGISAVEMHRCNLEGKELIPFPLRRKTEIYCQNEKNGAN